MLRPKSQPCIHSFLWVEKYFPCFPTISFSVWKNAIALSFSLSHIETTKPQSQDSLAPRHADAKK